MTEPTDWKDDTDWYREQSGKRRWMCRTCKGEVFGGICDCMPDDEPTSDPTLLDSEIDAILNRLAEQTAADTGEALKVGELTYVDQAKQAIKNLLLEAQISALKQLDDDFMPKDTNCAEFYQDPQESCEPIEHARRSGRFEVDMELHEFIDEEIKRLGALNEQEGK